MKIEALSIFSTFSSPVPRTRNVLKDQNGKPVVPDLPDELPHLNKSDFLDADKAGCGVVRFTPYTSKMPWHEGSRGVLSRLFPRYGNYCGPNWSSGRESGSLIWDQPPIDELDFCCYKHDIGYDSYEQADLHRADLVFLNCLEKMPREGRKAGDSPLSEPYRNLYIFGEFLYTPNAPFLSPFLFASALLISH